MKSVKYGLLGLASVVAILPIMTFAKTITNNNGIEISDEEYNNFIKVHSHAYIMTMDQKDYDKLKTLDYSNVENDTKYYAVAYNDEIHLTTEREITEEEYNNFSEYGIRPLLNSDGDYAETSAKKISLSLAGGSTWNFVTVSVAWKGIPSTRSFDIIGMRGEDFDFREGSQEGKQMYTLNGKYEMIDYAWNGTNIKKLDNGFGISMNIVNSNITELDLEANADIKPTATRPAIFGSYQHAIDQKMTLAESQSFKLTRGGLGGVFEYDYSISSRYDGMAGVYIQY